VKNYIILLIISSLLHPYFAGAVEEEDFEGSGVKGFWGM